MASRLNIWPLACEPSKAAYDLRKLRGKALVQRIANTRRYRVRQPGIRTLGLIPEKWTVEKCSSAQVKGAEGNEEKSVQ